MTARQVTVRVRMPSSSSVLPRKNAPLRISASSNPPGRRCRWQRPRNAVRSALRWQYSNALSRQVMTSKRSARSKVRRSAWTNRTAGWRRRAWVSIGSDVSNPVAV
nr:hypothetical protein [Verrucosispora sioxanthis]